MKNKAAKVVGGSFQFGFIIGFVITSLLGSALSFMWAMINTMQLINYIAMMSLYLPKTVMTMLTFVNVANMENEQLSSIFQSHFDASLLEERTSWDFRFENQGVGSTHILMNLSDILAGLIMLSVFYVVVWLLSV